jgi:hypothetical protein
MSNRITPARLDEIVRRAATDPTFRSQLLDDPTPALAQALGGPIPPNVRLKFIEKPSEYDALIVLPDVVSSRADLSDAELEAVAGGAADAEALDCAWTCSLSCEDTAW